MKAAMAMQGTSETAETAAVAPSISPLMQKPPRFNTARHLSLTPCFSGVPKPAVGKNCFNSFSPNLAHLGQTISYFKAFFRTPVDPIRSGQIKPLPPYFHGPRFDQIRVNSTKFDLLFFIFGKISGNSLNQLTPSNCAKMAQKPEALPKINLRQPKTTYF